MFEKIIYGDAVNRSQKTSLAAAVINLAVYDNFAPEALGS